MRDASRGEVTQSDIAQSDISRFVSDVFVFDTNNMSGFQYAGCQFQKQGDCSNCCERVLVKLP